MKRSILRMFVAGTLALAMALPMLSADALAKRAGGGGSFGSRPSYNRSYTPPAAPSAPVAPSSPAGPSQMNQQRPATPPPAAPSPGFGSRMGWGVGGFLMGGLLGSMLFGGGFGGGGFGGIGLLDILLIGGILFLGFKLLRGRSAASQSGAQGSGPQPYEPTPDSRPGAEQSWDRLRSAPPAGSGGAGAFGDGTTKQETPQGPAVPEGFNAAEFLEGAKTVYSRIQGAWDRRDMNDIALFTTPEVHQEMTRQAKADPGPSRTELLMVNAKLVEYREDGGDSVATVLFDVLMREDANEDRPKQVREVWHFSRETANPTSNWRLEGIQQLEG